MNQLTLRQIPSSVENKLRKKAHETGLSLNKTVISLLEKALGINSANTFKRTKKRNVAVALDSWSREEFEEFEKNTQFFNQIDEEMWK